MITDYLQYNFDTDTVSYPSGYDSTKLNLGHLMYKRTNENGELYVSPLEPKFLRGYEITISPPYSYSFGFDSLGSLKYNDDTIWLFYTNGTNTFSVKKMFLAVFNKSNNQFIDVGSISINIPPDNSYFQCHTILPSMERHTGGTITVSGTSVIGFGTTWLTDGVCVGNRIGFGSTNSDNITTWYRVASVNSNTGLTISREYPTDGNPSILNITGTTSYVIEDFRIIFMNNGAGQPAWRGIDLVKGLRYENFTVASTTIPAGTTVDNIRATYRILDSATTSATFAPLGGVLMDKTSFTNQDLYTMTYVSATNISIQRFNIRASLTLTAGRSNTPYLLTTGSQAHGGTNVLGYTPMVTDYNNNFYVTTNTRICRIPISGITASSTTFIVDSMVENPPGTSTTYPLSSQLLSGQYLRQANKFYISHTQGTIRNYVTSYLPNGMFDRPIHINDQNQQGTFLVNKFDNLTTNFLSLTEHPHYNDGILFLVRGSSDNRNIIYTLPIEADEEYHTITNSCIITPELTTLSATSYNRVYIYADTFFNKDQRFYMPRESYTIYYRTSGITTDTGSWTLLPPSGGITGSSNSIQFKLTFRTAGLYTIPCRIKGIILSYQSNNIPKSLPFYDPSLKFTDKTSNIFSWRQNTEFVTQLPELTIDVFDTSNNLLLTDTIDISTNGSWEYSNDEGLNWNPWDYSANSVGNYIRFSASTLTAPGQIIKPIIYPATPTPTPTPTVTPTMTPTPTPPPTPTATPNYDPDALTFISAAVITDNTEKLAVNQLVVDLKGYNIWTKLEALYPFVGGNATSHKFNLINPLDTNAAFRLLFSGGWTHGPFGLYGNASNAWANTYYNLSTNSTSTDISAGVYSRTNLQIAGISLGAETSSIGTVIALKWTDTLTYYSANDNLGIGQGNVLSDTRGFFITNRLNSTTKVFYKDGSQVTSIGTSLNSPPNLEVAFNARNQNGSIVGYDSRQYALAFLGNSLTVTDMVNFNTAVQAFQTSLGRAIGIGPQTVSDPDAQAFINAAVIFDQLEAKAINQLVIDLKSYNIWTKMKVIYPLVGTIASSQRFNLKNPLDTNAAFRLAFFGTTTHSYTGLKGNGSNAYANTFFSPTGNLTLNNNHISWYSRTSAARNTTFGVDLGVGDNASTVVNAITGFGRRPGDVGSYATSDASGNGTVTITSTDGSGFFIGSTLANNDRKLYKNSSLVGSLTTTVNQTFSVNSIYLLATNLNNSLYLPSDVELSFVSIGDGLDSTEVSNLNTAVQAFQTTLGR